MLHQFSGGYIVMFSFLFSFASIKADDIPAGVMPKRQVVGTGVTTSSTADPTSSTDPPSSTTPITSETPISDTPTSNTVAPTTATSIPPSSDDSTPTSDATTPTVAPTSDVSSPSATQEAPSSTIPTTIAVTTTNADGSVITSSIATSTLAPASSRRTSDGIVATESGSKNSIVRIGSSTIDPATLSHKTVVTSALVGSITSESVYTSYWTSDGQTFSSVITTDRVLASTTGFATATINPSLANGGGNGSNLSTNTKRVIGGVVGGIGGAILIGGLALVAWRLWGKKKRQEEGQEEWTDSQNDSIRREKTHSMSNYGGEVDRYRNPGGSVNTASNF